MADIVIFVTAIASTGSGDDVRYGGEARCSGMDPEAGPITWTADVDPGAVAATVNGAIKDAAIAAADVADFVVGALDKKTLLAGAVGL